jgi:amino acid transporter
MSADIAVAPPSLAEDTELGAETGVKLGWFDGFSMAMCIPNGIITSLGYTIAAVGAIPAMIFWSASSLIAFLQNFLYSEMATMFPHESGGIAVYANQAWRRHSAFVGPLATFGYWVGWSLTLGVVGETFGGLIQSEWMSSVTWTDKLGPITLGVPQLFAVGAIIASWLSNILGIRIAAAINRVIAVAFLVFIALVFIAPFFAGGWHASNLVSHIGAHPVITTMVWLYAAAWTVYGTEISATFTPEYRDIRRDSVKAMKYSALLVFVVYLVTPLAATGVLGAKAVAANPITYTVLLLQQAFGSWLTNILIVVVLAVLLLSMIAASADGGRAVYGIARQGLTLRQFEHLNRFGEPARALTVDMTVNILVVLLIASPLAILLAANLGYMVCTIFAISGFLLLRRDRPHWPRPVRLARPWILVAWVVLVVDVAITVVGATHPQDAGYGSVGNTLIALGVLALSMVLYVLRRVVQDKLPLQWRTRLAEDQAAVAHAGGGAAGQAEAGVPARAGSPA